MEINGYFTRYQKNEDGDTEIVFTIKGFNSLQQISQLQKDTLYRFKPVEVKSKRTIKQNSTLWALIHEISVARNTERATSDDDWDVYIEALEKAQAKFTILAIKPEAIPMFKESFRALKELSRFVTEKGVEMAQVKVFYGSSKMDVAEMGKLLDTVLDMASEYGIYLQEMEI